MGDTCTWYLTAYKFMLLEHRQLFCTNPTTLNIVLKKNKLHLIHISSKKKKKTPYFERRPQVTLHISRRKINNICYQSSYKLHMWHVFIVYKQTM